MKRIIQVYVSKGDQYYVAEGVDLPIVTQGKTLDELAENIQEAIELHLEGENPADFEFHLSFSFAFARCVGGWPKDWLSSGKVNIPTPGR